MENSLIFDSGKFTTGTASFGGEVINYRIYTQAYVLRPVAPGLQVINIIVREDMADDHSAPIMFIHRDGGVGEAKAWSFEEEYEEQHTRWSFKGHVMVGALNAPQEPVSVIARLLKEGYVVASPGVRGRETVADGIYVGRGDIPMTIVDLKAAVRFLRFNAGRVPGNTDKIISQGASSGGGSSALLGASGNSPLFDKYLEEIGAAGAPDDIYCAIVDSPIHDFEHIDIAYEWQFGTEYVTGLFADDADKTQMSRAAAEAFAEYVESLELKNPKTGTALSIKDGSYQAFMLDRLRESRAVYYENDENLEVVSDFASYINWNSGRWMKYVGCYDGFDENPSRENEAFGSRDGANGHFSVSIARAVKSVKGYEEAGAAWEEASLANADAVRTVNPYTYITGEEKADAAPVWMVRCGGHHETTGAIFMNLCLLLEKRADLKLNWRFCWPQNHTSISLKEIDETLAFLKENC